VAYDVAVPGGTRRRIASGDMFCLFDRVDDPCFPRSWLNRARDAFGTALSGQTFAASIYRNSARPAGVLQTLGALSDEGRQRLPDSWKAVHGGAGKAGKTPVWENGVEWKPLGMTAEDAELLESRKFSVAEICRIFRVPPPVISDLEKATFANI